MWVNCRSSHLVQVLNAQDGYLFGVGAAGSERSDPEPGVNLQASRSFEAGGDTSVFYLESRAVVDDGADIAVAGERVAILLDVVVLLDALRDAVGARLRRA